VASVEYAPWILTLALIGILYGALVAMVQSDVKKLVAYSSVAHLGFVMLGMFAFNVQGLEGSVLQMVNHGLSTGALFLLVGMLYERRHTRQLADFGGIARPMPVFAAFFVIVAMSSIGLPGLNGFVGELLILLGAFRASPGFAVPAAFGVVLAAAYLLWAVRRMLFGPVERPENRSLIDLDLRERAVVVALLVPIVWLGVYPETALARIRPAVIDVLHTMEARSARVAESGGAGEEVRLLLSAALPEEARR
jgi:NADH-quinone oxidoreductase subunit M